MRRCVHRVEDAFAAIDFRTTLLLEPKQFQLGTLCAFSATVRVAVFQVFFVALDVAASDNHKDAPVLSIAFQQMIIQRTVRAVAARNRMRNA